MLIVHLGRWGTAEAGGPETEGVGGEMEGREKEEKERGGGRVGDPDPCAVVVLLLGPGKDGNTRGVAAGVDIVMP